MKSILVAIFVVGMSGAALWRAHYKFEPCPQVLRAGESCELVPTANVQYADGRQEIIIGNVHIFNDSALCPWWIDPELWWNQSCTGGLPPRLPVPEGLR